MPKTLYAVRFFRSVAAVLARRIIRANKGRWPANLAQWQVVCSRCGFVFLLVADHPKARSCFLVHERALIITYTPDRRALYRAIAHEVAEGLIRDGGADGKYLLDWPRDEYECHVTARIVEEWVDVELRREGQLTLDISAEGLG